jgi:hypothetical protein
VRDLLTLRVVTQNVHEDAIRSYRFLFEAVTWPVLLAAAGGVIAAIRRRQGIAVFYGLWFITVFGLQTYGINHREARYLIAAFPPLYWFAATGLHAGVRLALSSGRQRRLAPAAAVVLGVALLALPAAGAVSAVARFQDPVYSENYEAAVSRYANSLAGSRAITWVGPYYPIHPRDYVFDRQDPFTYIYDFHWHVVSFWINRPVAAATRPVALLPDGSGALRVSWQTVAGLHDGDVLIVNRAPEGYDTGSMPAHLPPLVVERLALEPFAPTTVGAWASARGGQLRATAQGGTWRIEGEGLMDHGYDLFVDGPYQPAPSLTPVTVQGGRFTVSLDGLSSIDVVALISYGSARTFTPPGSAD